jgi:hypothetical protein
MSLHNGTVYRRGAAKGGKKGGVYTNTSVRRYIKYILR